MLSASARDKNISQSSRVGLLGWLAGGMSIQLGVCPEKVALFFVRFIFLNKTPEAFKPSPAYGNASKA